MEHKISLSTPRALHFTLLMLLSISDKLNHNSRSALAEHGLIWSWLSMHRAARPAMAPGVPEMPAGGRAGLSHPSWMGTGGTWRRMGPGAAGSHAERSGAAACS